MLPLDRPINVLSLCDGISSAQFALNQLGYEIGEYYASEVDHHAIKVINDNYPDSNMLGDITAHNEWGLAGLNIDIVVSGTPCQGFSKIGNNKGFDDPRSMLFFEFVKILKWVKFWNPNVLFFFENVSMKKEFEDVITESLGVEPFYFDSKEISPQQRKRNYWFNWDAPLLNCDTTTHFDSVLLPRSEVSEKYFLHANWVKWLALRDDLKKHFSAINPDKAIAMTARQYSNWKGNFVRYNDGKIRRLTPVECERLNGLPDNFTAAASDSQRYKMLGNGWQLDTVIEILKNAPNR